MNCLKHSRLSGFDSNIESNNALLTLADLECLDEDGFFPGLHTGYESNQSHPSQQTSSPCQQTQLQNDALNTWES